MLQAVFPWAVIDSQAACICDEAFYFTGFMGGLVNKIWMNLDWMEGLST